MNIAVIGAGHVGLVTAACFASKGHMVWCIDNDKRKIDLARQGKASFFEPGLSELIRKVVKENKLHFEYTIEKGISNAVVVFIAVGTPTKKDGRAELCYVEKVAEEIALSLRSYKLIVEKSTVPASTGQWIKKIINTYKTKEAEFDIASNPEFLKEGNALIDSLSPDRIVIGTETDRAKKVMAQLYLDFDAPKIFTSIESAELIKHASNSFLAMKISFINAVADICESVGGDINEVADGMGYDRRIGREFLQAGLGWGGSCFGKDLDAFYNLAEQYHSSFDLLQEVKYINEIRAGQFVEKIKKELWTLEGKQIGILGLSFKPGTDDVRDAVSFKIISLLQNENVFIKWYDPQADYPLLGTKSKNPYDAAKGSHCLCIVTEWDEFRTLDLVKIKSLMKLPIIIDGRNMFHPEDVRKHGFTYVSMGRK